MHARHPAAAILFAGLVLLTALAVAACGGGGGGDATAPTASATPAGGLVIGGSAAIAITFSESMDTASLTLGGNMAGESDGGAWSAGSAADDTLAVSPATTWSLGAGRTLTVDAKDPSGNALSTLSVTFTVVDGTFHYVSDSAGNDANDGLSPSTAKKTINAAIAAATAPANVLVAEGAHNVEFQASSHIVLVEGVSLFGGHNSAFTARDPAAHAATITDTSAVLGGSSSPNRAVEAGAAITAATAIDGFTLNGGGGDFSSAVVVTGGGAPTIRNNTINGGSGVTISYGIYNDASSPTISGNTINGGSGASSFGMRNDSSLSPTVSNNIINGGSGASVSYGIRNHLSTSPAIQNNTIDGGSGGVSSLGVYNTSTTLATISNNTIDGGSGVSDSTGVRNDASSSTISGNTINGGSGSTSLGVLNNTSSPTISGNTINGGSGANFSTGISSVSSTPVIEKNAINGGSSGNLSVGIFNNNSSPLFLNNNTIDGGSGVNNSIGIRNDNSSSPNIYNNTIDGGSGGSNSIGIMNFTSSAPRIENNIVFTSAGFFRFCLYEGDAAGDPTTVRNNDLFDCPDALYRDFDDSLNLASISAMEIDLGLEIIPTGGNVSADPLFVNQAGGDWHFTGSSPGSVTAGGRNGILQGYGFIDDKDGVTRPPHPPGDPWSIGAYEP